MADYDVLNAIWGAAAETTGNFLNLRQKTLKEQNDFGDALRLDLVDKISKTSDTNQINGLINIYNKLSIERRGVPLDTIGLSDLAKPIDKIPADQAVSIYKQFRPKSTEQEAATFAKTFNALSSYDQQKWLVDTMKFSQKESNDLQTTLMTLSARQQIEDTKQQSKVAKKNLASVPNDTIRLIGNADTNYLKGKEEELKPLQISSMSALSNVISNRAAAYADNNLPDVANQINMFKDAVDNKKITGNTPQEMLANITNQVNAIPLRNDIDKNLLINYATRSLELNAPKEQSGFAFAFSYISPKKAYQAAQQIKNTTNTQKPIAKTNTIKTSNKFEILKVE